MKKLHLYYGLLVLSSFSIQAHAQTLASSALSLQHGTETESQEQGRKNVPLKTALFDLKSKHKVSFVYESKLIENKTVSSFEMEGPLDETLKQLLEPFNLEFKKDKNVYVIISKSAKNDEAFIRSIENNRFFTDATGSVSHASTHPAPAVLQYLEAGRLINKAITISGKVIDDTGAPLPGVNVVLKGTTTGTTTSPEGNYTLTVPDGNGTLVFSFIGYTTEEVPVNNRTTIDVTLMPDIQSLSEVVVIGYGEQKKTTYTGSVSAIETAEITRAPVADISNNLAGRLPGVIATQRTGEPGADGANIFIRGIGTTGNTEPLVVIDGIPRPDYGFNQIDPNEIESISVLKDAAAAAVFGVRGANGVILITTKRGKAGKPQFSLSSRADFQVPTRLPKFLDSYNTAILYNEGLRNEGKPELYTPEALELYRNGSNPDVYPNTDWFDITLNDYAPQSQHNLNVSGGTDRARYFLSAGFLNQKGLYDNLQYKRYNFRSNIDVDVTKSTTVRLDLTGRLEDRNFPGIGAQGIFDALMRNQPLAVGYYSNGLPGIGRSGNPAEAVKKAGYTHDDRNVFQSLLSVTQQLPFVPGLSIKGQMAYDRYYQTRRDWRTPFPTYEFNPNTGEYKENLAGVISLGEYFEQNQNLTMEAHLNYNRTFGNHNITGLLLFTQTAYKYNRFGGDRNNFISAALPILDVGGADNQPPTYGRMEERARRGVVGRISYDLYSKYLFEANFRYDGSENFARDQRWGFFPSVSAGWRVSEEAFFKDNAPFIENLKIRGSIGQLGNDFLRNPQSGAAERFAFISAYSFGDPYVFNGTVVQTVQEGRLANLTTTWETATSANIGLEASLWRGLLTVETDLFHKRTKGILSQNISQIPASSGITALPFENLSTVVNRGVEVVVGHNNQVGDVKYYIRSNLTYARNTLTIPEPADINPNIRRSGRPIGQYFGWRATGLFQSQEEITNAPDQGPGVQPGDIRYADINNDNVIDDKDRVAIGRSPIPELTYGFTFGASLKGFDLNVLWQGAGRVSAYLSNESAWAFFNSGKATEEHLDRWTPENTDATYPRMSTEPTGNNTRTSSYWLRNAAYLRLKNVELGYTLPASLLSKAGIGSVRVYLVGQNLITFDELEILDPEGPGASGTAGRGWFYPQQRVFSMGLNVNF